MTGSLLRIYLFGEPRFEYRGEAWEFRAPPKTLPLLAYLLLHRGSVLARERIATALWPDLEPASSFANLRRHIHYLQRALPPDEPWMGVTSKSASWNVKSPYWLDIEAFDAESGDAQSRAHAVRLYGGDLYERCTEEWIEFERQRLRTLQLSNLSSLIERARGRGAYVEALQHAQLMLAADPWREEAVRAIMEIRMLLHDRAGALSEYERFAERLRDELNTEPLGETTTIYEQIHAAVRADSRVPASPASATADRPFVGRSNERAMLAEEWERARRGEGRAVFIAGEAGIGKTSLLESLRAGVEGSDAVVLNGGATSEERSPYALYAGIVRDAIACLGGTDRLSPSTRDALGAILPELRAAAFTRGLRGDEQFSLFEAFSTTIGVLAEQCSLLICLEDIHLASNAELELLSHAVLRLLGSRVLIVAAYREFEVGRAHPIRALRRELSTTRRFTTLALSAMDREDSEALVRARLSRPLSNDAFAQIYERSGGNPLFLIELARECGDAGFDAVPPSIAEIVGSRTARLDASSRDVLMTAAVGGNAVNVEVLAVVSGMTEAKLFVALDRLVETHFLRVAPGSGGIAFVHAVIRDALYSSLDASTKRTLHARFGLVMQEMHADRFEDVASAVAWHYDSAELARDAVRAHVVAAESALRAYALDEALAHAKKALDAAPDATYALRATRVLESVVAARGERERQREALDALLELSELGSTEDRADALLRYADFNIGSGGTEQRRALELLEAFVGANPSYAADVDLRVGEYRSRNGDFRGAVARLRSCATVFADRGDMESFLRAATALYYVSNQSPQPLAEIDAELDRLRTRADASADPRVRARLAYIRSGMIMDVDPAAAYCAAQDMLERACEAGDLPLQAHAHRNLGVASLRRMDLGEAGRHLERSEALTRRMGRARDIAVIKFWQLLYENRTANFERALAVAREGVGAAESCGASGLIATIECNAAISTLWSDRVREAEALLERSLRWYEENGADAAPVISVLGEVRLALGDVSGGIALLERSRASSSAQGDRLGVAAVHQPLLLGLAYLASGRTIDARECAARLCSQSERMRSYYFHPQAHLWATSQLLRMLSLPESAAFERAARARYVEIEQTFEDEAAREIFGSFVFNRLIREGVEVRDPLEAWFLPRNAEQARSRA